MMLTPKEVAADLRVSYEKVLRLIDSGTLVAINVGCGKSKPRYRIEQAEYEAFKLRQQKEPVVRWIPPINKPFKRRYLGPRVGEE